MSRQLVCHFAFLVLIPVVLAGGILSAGAVVKKGPSMSPACQSCYDDCVRHNKGPVCAMHCQSVEHCPPQTGGDTTTSKSPQ
jgi:hypothetical protein